MAEHTQTPRPKNREAEYEMEKPGKPPRPTTEPAGSAKSTRNKKTLTDPATGEPTRPN
jgi:hypothetical protein